nr:MAG: polyprotein pp1b [Bovine nidovirus 1]
MIKVMDNVEKEVELAEKFAADGVKVVPHKIVKLKGKYEVKCLVRGPTTLQSLGDYVYSFLAGSSEYIKVADRADLTEYGQFQKELKALLQPCVEGLLSMRKAKMQVPVVLDNIDMFGQWYDFEAAGCDKSYLEQAIGHFCQLYSMTGQPLNGVFDVNYEALIEGSWINKVKAFNKNLLNCGAPVTEIFYDKDAAQTGGYYNPVYGYLGIDKELLGDQSHFIRCMYALQDPSYRYLIPVYNVSMSTAWHSGFPREDQVFRQSFYDEELYEMFKKFGLDPDGALKYCYFQDDTAGVVKDVELYNYQGKLFLPDHILEYLYKSALQWFEPVKTDYRFGLAECKPRSSSLGPACPSLRGVKQDRVYGLAVEEDIKALMELSNKTPLAFCTKIVQKFALTAKARARTVASCSMFASTLFRALHKPVTAKFVSEAQRPDSKFGCLIGVSKFYGHFDTFVRTRHGDLEKYNVFGADYTKCDRSFPLVFRAATAAILFELGCYEPQGYNFVNEVNSFMLDFLECSGTVIQKTGGTSSGDATTAFSNSIYNYMVCAYTRLMYLVCNDVPTWMKPYKVAAVNAFLGYDIELMLQLNKDLDELYRFNFLSDDSFILSDKKAPNIFTAEHFSAVLETLIFTQVDRSKSWEADGSIHEFCSSEIKNIDGMYQYVPDFDRLLASLLINGKLLDDEMQLVRFAAILMEAAVYSKVAPMKWKQLFLVFKVKCDEFGKHGYMPLPPQMLEEQFYIEKLVNDKDAELLEAALMGVQLESAASACVACGNPTASKCLQCPVQVNLCAYCAYEHVEQTGHTQSFVVCCNFCGDDNVFNLGACYMGRLVTTCASCSPGYFVSYVDNVNKKLLLPYHDVCLKRPSVVNALEKEFKGFECNGSDKFMSLYLQQQCFLMDLMMEEKDVYKYELLENGNVKFEKDPSFGFTTYCDLYNKKNNVVARLTLDPVGNGEYKVFFPDKFIDLNKFECLGRTLHKNALVNVDFNLLREAVFIWGPPGTGKTTFIKREYFSKATLMEPVYYVAPTHALVQDIEAECEGVVHIAKGNNRVYKNPVDGQASVYFSTCGAARVCANSILIVDEVSLLTPYVLFKVLAQVKPKKVVFLGDPYQLAPVTPFTDFCWSLDKFWLFNFVMAYNVKKLEVCYRCPSNIMSAFSKIYLDAGVALRANEEGGKFEIREIPLMYDCNVELLRQVAAGVDIVLCNYKNPVVLGKSLGLNIGTIDSSQGATYNKVAVLLLGSSKFTKVLNRLVVALSRAKKELIVYCCPEVMAFGHEVFGWPMLENEKPVYKMIDYEDVDVKASGVCDIEFFHVHGKEKNYMGAGNVGLMTSTQWCGYLRPVLSEGSFKDSAVYVPKQWRYMMRHLPSEEKSEKVVNALLWHIVNTTDLSDNRFTFILWNGKSDIDALRPHFIEEGVCSCGKAAVVFSKEKGYCCQQHVSGFLVKLVCPNILDMRGGKLEVEHNMICRASHGMAHEVMADVNMTACIFVARMQFKSYVAEDKCVKCYYSPFDVNNRLYGNVLLYNNAKVDNVFIPVNEVMVENKVHCEEIVYNPKVKGCGNGIYCCKNCHESYLRGKEMMDDMTRYGFQVELQSMFVMDKGKQKYIIVEDYDKWCKKAAIYKVVGDVEEFKLKINREQKIPLPLKKDCDKVGIKAVYGFSHPELPEVNEPGKGVLGVVDGCEFKLAVADSHKNDYIIGLNMSINPYDNYGYKVFKNGEVVLQAGGLDNKNVVINEDYFVWHPTPCLHEGPLTAVNAVYNFDKTVSPQASFEVQILRFLTAEVKLPANCSYGGDRSSIYDYYFKNYKEENADIYISKDCMVDKVKKGGCCVWICEGEFKMPVHSFGEVKYFTPRIAGGADVVCVCFMYKGLIKSDGGVQFDVYRAIRNYRSTFVAYVRSSSISPGDLVKPSSVLRVAECASGFLSDSYWKSGRFIQ